VTGAGILPGHHQRPPGTLRTLRFAVCTVKGGIV
jgi:hypothetical protein